MSDVIPIHYCSFCGKSHNDPSVGIIIVAYKASITGICNLCVDLCSAVIAEKMQSNAENSPTSESKDATP